MPKLINRTFIQVFNCVIKPEMTVGENFPVDQIDCEIEFLRVFFQKINLLIIEKSFIDCLVCTGQILSYSVFYVQPTCVQKKKVEKV